MNKKSVIVKWGRFINGIPYYIFSLIPLFFAYAFIFDKNSQVSGVVGIIPLFLGLMFIIVGLSKSINTTEFKLINGNTLITKTKPIPVGGKINTQLKNIASFQSKSYSSGLSSSNGNYYLTIKMKNGEVKRIPNIPMKKDIADKYSEILTNSFIA